MNTLDRCYLSACTRIHCWKENFKEGFQEHFLCEERGAINMIEIIVLIVIVIAVAATFRSQLSEMITALAERVKAFINGSSTSSVGIENK